MATSWHSDKLRYIKTGQDVIAINTISRIDYRRLSFLEITIMTYNGNSYTVFGIDALETVLAIKPSAIEGVPSITWKKHVWAFHNLIGHPLMQLFAFMGMTRIGLWIHDSTVPSIRKIKKLP